MVSTNDLPLHSIVLKQTGSPSVAMAVRAQTMGFLAETMAVRVQTMESRV